MSRRFKLLMRLAAFSGMALALAFLSPSPAQAAGTLKIVTATTDLASLAQEVGGDRIEVESIARGYQDPHFVEAKPSFLLKLQKSRRRFLTRFYSRLMISVDVN